MTLSVVIITFNEEANLGRLLESTRPADEHIVLDCGSTDRTLEIARSFGARTFTENWKGYAAQKNSAIDKTTGDWVLSLDADEAAEPELMEEIRHVLDHNPPVDGYYMPRKNYFLGRWIRHGGFYPDRKLRLFRRGRGRFGERAVHEVVQVDGPAGTLNHALVHNAYPTLEGYIEHMNRYSSLGAEMKGNRGFSVLNIVINPLVTFVYNYFFRLGLLDGREGLLLNLYHSVYVSWKYAKAWERGRIPKSTTNLSS
ncbi:MAG TPA: glycosyltransferase family 2 protein [Terriglobales bacterium]|nr:glycosyltransferase family 2 protein [Terriglobales bacterium]